MKNPEHIGLIMARIIPGLRKPHRKEALPKKPTATYSNSVRKQAATKPTNELLQAVATESNKKATPATGSSTPATGSATTATATATPATIPATGTIAISTPEQQQERLSPFSPPTSPAFKHAINYPKSNPIKPYQK